MRISRHTMFMDMARVVAKRSTCHRLNVGALLVDRHNNVISMGYNGQAPGEPHCISCCEPGTCNTYHAEANAINRASLPKPRERDVLYTTHSPCMMCARLIISYGFISHVYFQDYYRDEEPLVTLVANAVRPIEVFRVLPNGSLFNFGHQRLVTEREVQGLPPLRDDR